MVPFPLLVPCLIIGIASVPLVLGVVPPNRFYGFRTRETLADRDVWLRANRFAGVALLMAAAVSGAIFLAQPEYALAGSVVGLGVLVVPLVVAMAASFVYVGRLSGSRSR